MQFELRISDWLECNKCFINGILIKFLHFRNKDEQQSELDQIYQIMQTCWAIDPSDRPKFVNMQHDLEHYRITGDLSGYAYSSQRKAKTSGFDTYEWIMYKQLHFELNLKVK